jgi:hypothetical protein
MTSRRMAPAFPQSSIFVTFLVVTTMLVRVLLKQRHSTALRRAWRRDGRIYVTRASSESKGASDRLLRIEKYIIPQFF